MKASRLKPPAAGRRRMSDLGDLRQSWATHGQLQPVVVQEGSNEVIIGERRRQAAKPTDDVDVVLLDVDDLEALVLRASEEFTKVDLDPMARSELVQAIKRAMEEADGGEPVTATALAEVLGVGRGTVSRYLALDDLPKPVQKLVAEHKVDTETAAAIARSNLNERERVAFATKVSEDKAPRHRAAAPAIRVIERAPTATRAGFTQNRGTTFTDVERELAANKARDARNQHAAETGMTAGPFYRQVRGKLRNMRASMQAIVKLLDDGHYPDRGDVEGIVTHVTFIRDRCNDILRKLAAKNPPEPRRSFEKAASVIDVSGWEADD